MSNLQEPVVKMFGIRSEPQTSFVEFIPSCVLATVHFIDALKEFFSVVIMSFIHLHFEVENCIKIEKM